MTNYHYDINAATADNILEAARVLISHTRGAEGATRAELSLQLELPDGGVEDWTIMIERKAARHVT